RPGGGPTPHRPDRGAHQLALARGLIRSFNGPGPDERHPGDRRICRMWRMNSLRSWCLLALLAVPAAASHAEEGKLRVLLLGDSTTIGRVCRRAAPDGPHLEDVIWLLLAAEPDLPPAEVINQGRDGEYIRGLLSSGRYDKEITPLGAFDYVLI